MAPRRAASGRPASKLVMLPISSKPLAHLTVSQSPPVLIGTVVAIYVTFPTRNTVLMTEALQRHRDNSSIWDLTNPTSGELRAWAIGVVGKDPPLPEVVLGARELEVLGHRAAVMRIPAAGENVTYLVQYTRVIAPDHAERTDGDLHDRVAPGPVHLRRRGHRERFGGVDSRSSRDRAASLIAKLADRPTPEAAERNPAIRPRQEASPDTRLAPRRENR